MTTGREALHVALAGAGGTTGSAVLQDWLGRAEVARVTVLTTQRFLQMPPRMADAVVPGEAWQDALPTADHAVIVCGTPRRARESVYWQPPRELLVPLATARWPERLAAWMLATLLSVMQQVAAGTRQRPR